ncbi:MAG TPA: PP2C family protein-serine/threonine phosphatase [Vicinamibacteria bacterium]|nr:PP2C family protein-serine/threonine phosphatase [Vicinamibacteria bacterium]
MSPPLIRDWLDRVRATVEERSRDLGIDELHTLVRRDTARAYDYYQRDQKRDEALPSRGLERYLSVTKAVFLSFLRKLTPARRLAYVIALLTFLWGFIRDDWTGALVGFVVLNFLLALELAEKLLTKDELEIARVIQFSLYPVANPKLPNLDVASYFLPASEVGGDYYDFAFEGSRRFTVILGDVSGKGIPAALYAMRLQALFEVLGKGSLSPKQMLVEMNDVISERIERNYFITAVVAVVDFRERKLVLARAGHNHPLHYSAETGETRWLAPEGVGIGMRKKPAFDGLMEESQLALGPGDVLLFYTDGVSETMNRSLQPYGYDRLEVVLRETAHRPASEIKEALLRSLNAFREDRPFDDDVTLVVTKVTG